MTCQVLFIDVSLNLRMWNHSLYYIGFTTRQLKKCVLHRLLQLKMYCLNWKETI